MPLAILLFNGIHFSSNVMEAGIQWAKKNKAPLRALFIFQAEQSEGYGFPSDLDIAQESSSTKDANADDRNIIKSSMEILQHACKNENVELQSTLLENPTDEEIIRLLIPADYVFASDHIKRFTIGGLTLDPTRLADEIPGKWIEIIEN